MCSSQLSGGRRHRRASVAAAATSTGLLALSLGTLQRALAPPTAFATSAGAKPGAGIILVGGENLIDFIQTDAAGLPEYRANPGGSPYNLAKALARQLGGGAGAPPHPAVGYLTPISSDELGELLAKGLLEAGVELLAARRAEPTSLAVVSFRNGQPTYQFYRDGTAERMVTLDALESIHASRDALALHVGSLALTGGADADVWADFYCQMNRDGVFTSLDPNIRPAFIKDSGKFTMRLERVLQHTDLLKLSDEDLEWLDPSSRGDLRGGAARLLAKSRARLAVVTMGAGGAFALLPEGKEVSVQASSVNKLVDTVGAGDTFSAALLAALAAEGRLSARDLEALSLAEVEHFLRRAARAAALNCAREGCDPPSRSEVAAAMRQSDR